MSPLGASGRAPVNPAERSAIIDAVRGVAVLGIVIINVAFLTSPAVFAPDSSLPTGGFDSINGIILGAAGWLAAGKFLSLLAILFGIGMGAVSERLTKLGLSGTTVMVRRSSFLIVLGFLNMVLLFPGDILFVYGLTSFVTIFFLRVPPRRLLYCSAGLLVLGFLLYAAASLNGGGNSGSPKSNRELYSNSLEAFQGLDIFGILASNLATASEFQQGIATNILFRLLPLFLLGVALARIGFLANLQAYKRVLKWGAALGLSVGLPLNLVFFLSGVFGAAGVLPIEGGTGWQILTLFVEVFGVPLLALGYGASLALLFMRFTPPRPIVAVGRMALTVYLLENLLVLVTVLSLGLYGNINYVSSLIIVFAIWILALFGCTLWLTRFQFGPLEAAWRIATYGGERKKKTLLNRNTN